jgi:Protein of unknown function (DUF1499)
MRRVPPDPLSLRAVWARRFGWFAVVVAGIAAFSSHFGLLPVPLAMVVLFASLAVAVLGILFALAAFVQIWNIGARGVGEALVGFVLSLVLLGVPAGIAAVSYRLPAINDISTDLVDPPAFSRSRKVLDARGGHVPTASTEATRALQKEGYGDIQGIVLDLPAEEAFPLVLQAAKNLGWKVLEQSAPSIRGNGRLEAVQTSLIMRFPDDITVRVRPLIGETRIDVRSVSRYGKHDFGVNAKRVRAFVTEMTTLSKSR